MKIASKSARPDWAPQYGNGPSPRLFLNRPGARRAERGFTLPEMLIASTIFLLLVGGVVSANLFGLRIFQMTESKLDATQWSRQIQERVTDEIHVCTSAQVGTVSNGVFAAFLDGETQQGNGLLINTSTNTNSFVIYFLNAPDNTLRRTTNVTNSTVILASYVTNTVPFSAQDFSGNILTNTSNGQVIHMTLEFYQPGRYFQSADYYKLETSVRQRVVP